MPARNLFFLLVLAVATGIAYSNSLFGEFLYDDQPYVTKNSQTTGEAPIFSESTPAGRPHLGLYRPVFILSLRINHLMAGFQPSVFHGTNLLLHFLAVAALYLLIHQLTDDRPGAFLGALLFAVHPAHVEAVSWIVGRAELLSFLFCALAAIVHFKAARKPWLRLVEGALFIVACLSKENALVFPLLLWLIERYGSAEKTGSGIRSKMCLGKTVAGYWFYPLLMAALLCLRYAVLGRISPAIETAPFQDVAFWGRLEAAFAGLAEYARVTVYPCSLKIFYHISEIRSLTITRLLFLAFFLLVTVLAFKKSRRVPGWLLWFPAALLPVLNLVPIGAVFAERFLYLPSAGICAASGLSIMALIRWERARRGTHLTAWIPTAVILCFCSLTIARNPVFNSSLNLWKDAVHKGGGYAFPHYNLGECYFEHGSMEQQSPDTQGAVFEFRESIRLNPDHPYAFAAHFRLGQYHLHKHRQTRRFADLGLAAHHLVESYERSPPLPLPEAKWKPALLLAGIPLEKGGEELISFERARAYLEVAERFGAPEEQLRPLRASFERMRTDKENN